MHLVVQQQQSQLVPRAQPKKQGLIFNYLRGSASEHQQYISNDNGYFTLVPA